MKTKLFLAALCLSGSAVAQLPMSDFVRTYSFTHTRGYFFQAPVDFTVTALQVPDETNKGQYHVGLYRTTAAPASSGTITPVFLKTAVKSDQRAIVIPPVKYKKGEWFAVLGVAGPNTGNVFNSYGATGTVPSRVLGHNIGLQRLMLQTNIAVSKGVGAVFTNTSNIARVRVWVNGQGAALPFGSNSGPNPGSLTFSDPNPPLINFNGGMFVMPGQANNGGGLLAIGIKQINVKTSAGTFLVDPVAVLGLKPIPAAGTRVTFAIPNQKSLLGLNLFFQAAERQGSAFSLTNGMSWTVNN